MATGEFTSVTSQNELVRAEVELERQQLKINPKGEQDELAQRAGLKRSTLTLIEQGKRGMDMSVDTCWRIAWALGTSVDMLIGLPELRG